MRITTKKTTRLMNQLVAFLRAEGVCGRLDVSYDRKKHRDLYSQGKEFLTSEKMVDSLLIDCMILGYDLTKSGIKCSRGYDVFVE